MATIIIHHEVQNYEAWRRVFDAVQPKREASGELAAEVYRGADNVNAVTVVTQYTSVEAARAWFSDPALKQKMQEAGVKGPPTLHYLAQA